MIAPFAPGAADRRRPNALLRRIVAFGRLGHLRAMRGRYRGDPIERRVMAMPLKDDLLFWLRRAEQEAISAIVAEGKAGSPAHFELSLRYSALAIRALSRRVAAAPA